MLKAVRHAIIVIISVSFIKDAVVVGIDVEKPVLEQCRQRASRENLSDRITYRLVEPGPLPFADESFDAVFSKDSMIHIPDKAALFKDVFRVLTPGGIFVASDWMRCDANPPSKDMQRYIESEELSYDMAPPENYAAALQEAGFEDITLRDRNSWYAALGRNEYEQMKGPLYQTLVDRAGQAEANRNIEVWRTMCVVLDSGELRPGHMRAVKPHLK